MSPFPPETTAQLNTLFSALDGEQAAWLLGYLGAARQTQKGDLAGAPRDPKANGESRLTVLFASQTGNAAKVARRLAALATEAGIHGAAVDIADYKVSNLQHERNLVLVSSTHGEGVPPDSAVEFQRFLFGKRVSRLERLRFAVLALGDCSYDHFCKAGADFDRRLEELGGERVLPRVDCDVEYHAAAEAWQAQVIAAFAQLVGPAEPANAVPRHAPATQQPAYDKKRPFSAPVLDRTCLNGRGSAKSTVHLELSLSGSGIDYQPGDNLGVWPRNSREYVRDLLAAAHLPADARVSVDGKDVALGDALMETFEVTTITRFFLNAYAPAMRQPELASLLDKGNEQAFRNYCAGRELVDVLLAYPPSGLEAQAFLGMLRRLQPRLYSIASSLRAHEDEAHLIVGFARWESHARMRAGVCSGYLCERMGEDELLPVYLSPNPGFKLPADPDARIIMIGPGTGVAPFRAFMEEREALGCRGRNWLFFGEQHFATDFLYQLEWQRWHRSGMLSELELAFSRDQDSKVYVQHRMLARSRDLYSWLQAGAHVYVCGSANQMASDVEIALVDVVAKEGGLDRDKAREYVDGMRAGRRYQRDVY